MRYRGRLAPTPSGFLHVGHARTFHAAWKRAREAKGELWLRFDDLDAPRCREEYVAAAIEDLAWLGIDWDPAPDATGPHGSVRQRDRMYRYLEAFRRLAATGAIYPCSVSRADVARALAAPHEGEEDTEPVFPASLRPPPGTGLGAREPGDANWRFRVPDGERLTWVDAGAGPTAFTAGTDFGDFLVWRKDGVPSYDFACAVDDLADGMTEVVRGADLLRSAARQSLVARALGADSPAWCHVPLVRDSSGRRLAKRSAGLSIREIRTQGGSPSEFPILNFSADAIERQGS